jgi:hypothetical protein
VLFGWRMAKQWPGHAARALSRHPVCATYLYPGARYSEPCSHISGYLDQPSRLAGMRRDFQRKGPGIFRSESGEKLDLRELLRGAFAAGVSQDEARLFIAAIDRKRIK